MAKQKKEISINELMIFAIAAFVVSIFSTMSILGSFGGITGASTSGVGSANITVESTVDITLPITQVLFSNSVGETNDSFTATSGPDSLQVQNDGSTAADINITFSKAPSTFWSGSTVGVNYLQWNCSVPSAIYGTCQVYNNSPGDEPWKNVTTSSTFMIDELNCTDATDNASLRVAIQVPVDEPAGAKSATITFSATSD